MPSFQDSIAIFFLALLLFGPKKLPVLAREIGKWLAEFRRASNEFKMQMEDELRAVEQAERDKKVEAITAAAPATPELPAVEPIAAEPSLEQSSRSLTNDDHFNSLGDGYPEPYEPEPIATSGDLNIMPPETGLPTTYGEHPSVEATDPAPTFENSSNSGLMPDGTRRPDPASSEATHG